MKNEQADLSSMIMIHSSVVEVVQDLLDRSVLLDLALGVEADHVTRVDRVDDLERLLESVLLDRFLSFLGDRDDEVDGRVGVVLLVILLTQSSASVDKCTKASTNLDECGGFLSSYDPSLERLLVVLSPHSNRQLVDLDRVVVDTRNDSRTSVFVFLLLDLCDRSLCIAEGSAVTRQSLEKEKGRRTKEGRTLNPRYHGCIGSSSSPAILRFRLATMSEGL